MEKETIGKFISRLKKEKSITGAELARKVGVSRQTMSYWEHDQRTPSIKHILKLADALNISHIDILNKIQ